MKNIVIALLVVIGLVVWWLMPYTIRYRLTLFVENGGQTVQGSSVVETRWLDTFGFIYPWRTTYSGEATVVDLGDKGVLFALLPRGVEPPSFMTGLFAGDTAGGMTRVTLHRVELDKRVLPVPFNRLPMLVRFRDINDPTTVERVDPNDLAASFGPGTKLVGATIEITSDRETMRIEKFLPWLVNSHGMLDGQLITISNALSSRLSSYDFRRPRQ